MTVDQCMPCRNLKCFGDVEALEESRKDEDAEMANPAKLGHETKNGSELTLVRKTWKWEGATFAPRRRLSAQ